MVRKTRNSTRGAAKAAKQQQQQSEPQEETTPAAAAAKVVRISVSEKDRRIRKRALKLLQQCDNNCNNDDDDNGSAAAAITSRAADQQQQEAAATRIELPVLYAALKQIKEIGAPTPPPPAQSEEKSGNGSSSGGGGGVVIVEDDTDLSLFEIQLIHHASLAVPYVMYKKVSESFMLPRTMGGLAFSDAKAKQVARDLFVAMGPACCSEHVTEELVAPAMSKNKQQQGEEGEQQQHIEQARKLIPALKAVGAEARSQWVEIRTMLRKGEDDDEEEEDGNEDDEEEEDDDDDDDDDGSDNRQQERDDITDIAEL